MLNVIIGPAPAADTLNSPTNAETPASATSVASPQSPPAPAVAASTGKLFAENK